MRNYKQLSLAQRYQIEILKKAKSSQMREKKSASRKQTGKVKMSGKVQPAWSWPTLSFSDWLSQSQSRWYIKSRT